MPLLDVARFIREHDGFLIVHHHDADGLCSAGIMGLLMESLGKKYKFMGVKQLDPENMARVKEKNKKTVFVDLGSGSLDMINSFLDDYAVIDHHQVNGTVKGVQYNPREEGHNGDKEFSGSTACYLVAKELGVEEGVAKLAVIGSVGDMQDRGTGLIGLNKSALNDAVKAGEVEVKKDLVLFGRNSRPLTQFLFYASDPFIPGVSGSEQGSLDLLKKAGITLKQEDGWRYYCDLSQEEKRALFTELYKKGLEEGVSENLLESLIGEVYDLPKEKPRTVFSEAKEFATLLNACGRNQAYELGVKVCMGERENTAKEALTLLRKHRENLRKGIEIVQERGYKDKGSFYYFEADEIPETIIGTVAGMAQGSVVPLNKPVLAGSRTDDGRIKISARASWALVRKGLNLGRIMRKAAEKTGGVGGGHRIAAGATVPEEKLEEFLRVVKEMIK